METQKDNFTDLTDIDDDNEETVITKTASKEILSITMADLFTADQCKQIRETIIDELWLDVKVIGNEDLHKGFRQKLRGSVTDFPFLPIKEITKQANDSIFDFDLLGIIDQDYPQVFKYDTDQYYNYHVDINPLAPSRKISFIVNLTGSDECQGGNIEFINTTMNDDAHMKQGTIIIFPSFMPYRITPVTSGSKLIIVGHIHGALFK